MNRRRRRASAVWSQDWLLAARAPAGTREATSTDLAARIDDLPDVLRAGTRVADTLLGFLPIPVVRRASRLPAVSQFARLVESLTVVSFFALAESAVIPAPRPPVSATVESRA